MSLRSKTLLRTSTVLTTLALGLLCAQACGGGDPKKKAFAPDVEDAGPDGGDAAIELDAGPDVVIEAGPDAEPDVVIEAGPDAEPDAEPDADSGEPQTPPLELVFGVGRDSTGLAGSAVAAHATPHSSIFASSSGAPEPVNGSNSLVIEAADLGLLPSDEIDAITIVRPEPQNPIFLFSVDGAEGLGLDYTRVFESEIKDGPGGDVYFSDGVESFRYLGEGGDEVGYNGMFADETSLGLVEPSAEQSADLKDFFVRRADEEITEVYFSVRRDAVGPSGSALESTPEEERGCTIYRSALDGTHSVAYTCAQLGLDVDNEVDALAIFGDPDPERILFSVSWWTLYGLPDTATEFAWGASIYETAGDDSNTNTLYLDRLALGLSSTQDIDGFTVVDQPLPRYAGNDTCTLSEAPDDAISFLVGQVLLGTDSAVFWGESPSGEAGLVAYDLDTCERLGSTELPLSAVLGSFVMVPLPNWSAAMPFANVEYWRFVTGFNQANDPVYQLERRDAEGDPTGVYELEITGFEGGAPAHLTYDPIGDRFFATAMEYANQRLFVVPRPGPSAPETTPLTTTVARLYHPCASPHVAGLGGLETMIFAQLQDSSSEFRVCAVSPSTEFAAPPIIWRPEAILDNNIGTLFTPGYAYSFQQTGNDPIQIWRATLVVP